MMYVGEMRGVIKHLSEGDTFSKHGSLSLNMLPPSPHAPAAHVSWAFGVTRDVVLNTTWGKSPHGLFSSGYEKYKLRLTE